VPWSPCPNKNVFNDRLDWPYDVSTMIKKVYAKKQARADCFWRGPILHWCDRYEIIFFVVFFVVLL